jgi:hypothetical protein
LRLVACLPYHENLGTVAAAASIFRANPVVLFETIVIYSSKPLVGLYLLGKFLKPVLECADIWGMEKISTQ